MVTRFDILSPNEAEPTSELREFLEVCRTIVPKLWKIYNGRSRSGSPTAGARHGEHRAKSTTCRPEWLGGWPTGPCVCIDYFADLVADTIVQEQARFASDPHYRPADGSSYADRLAWQFTRNNRVVRQRRGERGGIQNPSGVATGATWAALPDDEHRWTLHAVVDLAGTLSTWRGLDPFLDLVASRVRAKVPGGPVAELRDRLPEMLAVVEKTANATLAPIVVRDDAGEKTGELIPWFTARVWNAIGKVDPDFATLSEGEQFADSGRGIGEVLRASDDVEHEVEAAVLRDVVHTLAGGPLATQYLASRGTGGAGVSAVLLAGDLAARLRKRSPSLALRRSVRYAVRLGELESSVAGRIIADPVTRAGVLDALAATSAEALAFAGLD